MDVQLICGIDPGQSGGIAFIGEGAVEAFKMPDTEADTYELLAEYAPRLKVAYMESVHSFPGQGVSSSFTFGRGYGFLRGVLVALKVPFVDVSPMKWKKSLGLIFSADDAKKDKKNGSKQLAQQWFPHVKMTHAISEAVLIAEYGQRLSK